MHQHNATGDGARNCWNSARDRKRLAARHRIQQRFQHENGFKQQPQQQSLSAHPIASFDKVAIQEVLQRILKGDRSYFSVHYMETHHELLNTSFSNTCLFVDDNQTTLLGHEQWYSWLREKDFESFRQYISKLETVTFIEYAVWMKRYWIVSTLILGGIHACGRGRLVSDDNHISIGTFLPNNSSTTTTTSPLLEKGDTWVTQQFLSKTIPLSLSTYMVTRVVGMRRSLVEQGGAVSKEEGESCPLCDSKKGPNEMLLYSSFFTNNRPGCGHFFCESCLWRHLLENVQDRFGDVVQCPVCAPEPTIPFMVSGDQGASSRQRDASRAKYLELPRNAKELKARKVKRTSRESEFLTATWSEAVQSSLGRTQDVRRDKFFNHVQKGSFHHVKGCLERGVDVNFVNEYGQTGLFLAVAQGNSSLVRLLLEYGSCPNHCSHGGVSCWEVAQHRGCRVISDLLHQAGATGADVLVKSPIRALRTALKETTNVSKETLIDWESNHPGAGSFVLDGVISESANASLINLFRALPIDESSRKKKAACATRSYFCDSLGILVDALECQIQNSLGCSHVFPQMRFLNYDAHGTVLDPHRDLCRVTGDFRSTHSFLLYLTECTIGGETALLNGLSGMKREQVVAKVQPRPSRLLLFPHQCPHEGLEVVQIPKLLVRGEVRIVPREASSHWQC